jgi:hypothetical protein
VTGSRPPTPAGAGLLRLYPSAWRRRYEDEVRSILEEAPVGRRQRLDLVRGALDAWLHPERPSALPGVLAVLGGLLLAVVALDIVRQPTPPDWPGYLQDTLLVAFVAVALLTGAVVGAWLRSGEGSGRLGVVAVDVAIAGHVAWAIALLLAVAGVDYGPTTALAQDLAAVGTVLVGLSGLRQGRGLLGVLLVVVGGGLLVPSAWAWLASGLAWIVVGVIVLREAPRPARPRPVAA